MAPDPAALALSVLRILNASSRKLSDLQAAIDGQA